jgi:hypothetical protein
MSTIAELERRVAAVEAAVNDLRRSVVAPGPPGDWLARFDGAFENEPAFAEVVRYGRELREADRPAEDPGP